MKRLLSSRTFQLVCLTGVLGLLNGCAGFTSVPDTSVGEEGALPEIHGSVFGGHAPIVGAHLYVLQVGSGAIGAPATSLLGGSGTTAPPGYPLAPNVNDPYLPVGAFYVTTDAFGGFGLSGGYKCTAGVPVYLYAYGGAPTVTPPGVPNPSIVNLATLGTCPFNGTFKGTISYVYMNEVSTVATAYAFQGFTSPANNDAVHIGYDGTHNAAEGLTGIVNASQNTFQLYDITGSIAGHSANTNTFDPNQHPSPNKGIGIVPQAVLDTLANILAACVDSGNATTPATTTQCTLLFSTATGDGTTTNTAPGNIPIDTAAAAINIARHPAGVGNPSFASTLFGSTAPAVPFLPYLTVAPKDFTVGIEWAMAGNSIYTGPQSIVTDAGGNFWFTTQPTSATTSGYLAEDSPLGNFLHSTYNASQTDGNIAIDSLGDGWTGTLMGKLANSTRLTPAGVGTSYGTGFTRAASPVADNSVSSGNLYFMHGPTCPIPANGCTDANNNPMLTVVSSSGVVGGSSSLTSSFFPGDYISHAAMDSAGYIWMTSENGNVITRVNKSNGAFYVGLGSLFPIAGFAGLCGAGWVAPEQPAIDRAGNAWVPINGTNGQGTGVFKINAAGTSCNYFDTEGGSSVGPYGAAIDGASNVWITNRSGGGAPAKGSLTELNTAGAPLSTANYQPENQLLGSPPYFLLFDPMNVAVDISGDILITDFSGSDIVELIGLGTPAYGPLGVAAGAGYLGNTP